MKIANVKNLLDECLKRPYFYPNRDGVVPIPVHRVKGNDPLVVMLGENASGKSFMRRIVRGLCSMAKIECIHLSMEGRGDFGVMKGFVYGDESWEATGANSGRTVLTGIATCQSRETSHVIFWDEPDLGLSEGAAAGAGKLIAEFAAEAHKPTKAAIVVTHSRALVNELVKVNPHYLFFGEDCPESIEEWLAAKVEPRSITELMDTAHKRFKLIQEILDGGKKDKR